MSWNLQETFEDYLQSVNLSRSKNTVRTYSNALAVFAEVLEQHGFPPSKTPLHELREDWISLFADGLKSYAPATEKLYLTAAAGWYEFLSAEALAAPNLSRVRLLIRRRGRRPGRRLPQFPREAIEQVIDYVNTLHLAPADDPRHSLQNFRDRAFILTLADTGLRVNEACNLRRGDIDWNEGHALLIGKGDKESLVRFSNRSLTALKDYLSSRASIDGGSGKPLSSLPLFARHDKGAGKKVLPISTTTGRAIVHRRTQEAPLPGPGETITPHDFRHYFVTTVLRASGGNLKLAQELARHQNIAVTQRYAHLSDDELDRGYHKIFNDAE